jgi:tetratricopeptide (TPR) repeat protein
MQRDRLFRLPKTAVILSGSGVPDTRGFRVVGWSAKNPCNISQRIPLRVFLLLLIFMSSAALFAQSDFYKQGRAAYDTHDWETAIKLMTNADQSAPGKTDALLIAAKASVNLNKLADADKFLTTYLTYHPNAADALYLLGTIQQREDKPRESLTTFTRAAKLQTPTSEQLRIVGLDYVLLDDYPDAIHWLERAVQMDDSNAKAWYSLGRSYYTQSRFGEAERAFKKALALDPENMKATENLGLVFDAENKPNDADASFKASVALADKTPQTDEWPYLDYGGFLLNQNRAQEAIPLLEQAVRINPNCAACHEKLGRALESTGQTEQAITHLERAVALSDKDPHLHYELGLAYRKAGQKDRAEAEMALSQKLYGTRTPTSQK